MTKEEFEKRIIELEQLIRHRQFVAKSLLKQINENGWDPENPDCRWGTPEHEQCYWTVMEYRSMLTSIQINTDVLNHIKKGLD